MLKKLRLTRSSFNLKEKMRKFSKGSQKAWAKLSKPAVNNLTPVFGMAVRVKSRTPQNNVLKEQVLFKSVILVSVIIDIQLTAITKRRDASKFNFF